MNVEEELIESVKKYPILFDPSEKEYRNKNVRNEAWEEIGQILEIPGNECKELWTKIRNAYTNAMKRRKSKAGQGTKNLVKWKYEDQMDFLVHTLEQRTTDGDIVVKVEGASEDEEISQEVAFSSSQPLASHEENVSHSPYPPLSTSSSSSQFQVPTTSKNTKIEISKNEMVASMKENSRVMEQTSSSNELDMYFLSLSKTVQRLSPEEQVRVKMEVGNVVFQAEFRELQRVREEQGQGSQPYPTVIHPPTYFNSSISLNTQTSSSLPI